MRIGRRARRWEGWCLTLVATLFGLGVGGGNAQAQTSIRDPAFAGLRQAAASWDRKLGPDRQIVDVVCLVPDVPTFFEAVAAWDDKHFFPILIDDVEYTLKFLRAFRPSKIVRYPGRGTGGTAEELWTKALIAAGLAWVPDGLPPRDQPRGDVVPRSLGPVPPAVVVTHPGSPSLAGAVALAAGRFQPLLRWQIGKGYGDVLTTEEALQAMGSLEAELAGSIGHYWELGDDVDFVTLAGDYPYRFMDKDARNAFDDMILRSYPSKERWGYAGRLIGDPVTSVYRAMCGLFLPAKSGLMFNGYGDGTPPWTDFAMTGAAALLNRRLKVAQRVFDRAKIDGWHQAFDPVNPYDLLLVNTSGGASDFGLFGGSKGQTADVPESGPVAIHMIHSFSAWSPEDTSTIAGRWLANGAFVYFGSTNEPYLQAFRTPILISTCLDENLPMVAAVRKLHFELFGQPWRLIYLGDPLYRIQQVGNQRNRLRDWEPLANWTAYQEYRPPDARDSEAVRLNWALKTAIVRLQAGSGPVRLNDVTGTLLGIDRERLDAALRPYYDALLVDTLSQTNRNGELLDRLQRIPQSERSSDVSRHLETAQAAALARASASNDFRQAMALWTAVLNSPIAPEYFRIFTERVGDLAKAPNQLSDWRDRLNSARKTAGDSKNAPVLDDELKRVDVKLRDAGRGG
ncbi:MAG: hypothetical protein AB7I30_14885 [Isosphaeraceae bacterium]